MLNALHFLNRTHTRMQQAHSVQTKFLAIWGGSLAVAIVAAALSSAIGQDGNGHWFQFFQVLAIGIVVAGASAMVGWLFGLLFGIPRSIATPAAQPAAPVPAAAPLRPVSPRSYSRRRASTPTLKTFRIG